MQLLVWNAYITVFPLNLLRLSLDKYFISATGDVYSTKRGKASLMYGNGNHYVTLSNMTYDKRVLLRQAKDHMDWKAHMLPNSIKIESAPAKAVPTKAVPAPAPSAGYVIATQTKDGLIFGSKPKVHPSLQSAKDEMLRLATLNPGVKFIRLKIDGSVIAGAVTWE